MDISAILWPGTVSQYKLERGVWTSSDHSSNREVDVDSFSLQWTEYQATQMDDETRQDFTLPRLLRDTGWNPETLKGKLVCELGSGPGRFTRELLDMGAQVVAVDASQAIFVNADRNCSSALICLHASIENLPLQEGIFDFVLVFGIAQHLKRPLDAYETAVRLAKPGSGQIAIDHYEFSFLPSPWVHPKYLWRPVTRRLKPERLMNVVRWYIPKYLPFDTSLRRKVPHRLLGLIPIPCWNYAGVAGVGQSPEVLNEWAVLDTFDALASKYDRPWTRRRLARTARRLDLTKYQIDGAANGIVLRGVRGNVK